MKKGKQHEIHDVDNRLKDIRSPGASTRPTARVENPHTHRGNPRNALQHAPLEGVR